MSAGPGRPREFDPGRALEAAMHVFWDRGYEATSMEDLERGTGLARSSLYNSFGSKRELFERALAEYARRAGSLMRSMESGSRGLADLRAFFDALHARLGARAHPGCLMVNSVVEFAGADPGMSAGGRRYFARVHHALECALLRAESRGEMDAAPGDGKADVLLAMAIAMNVHARNGASRGELIRLRRAADRLLSSWERRSGRASADPRARPAPGGRPAARARPARPRA